MEKHDLSIVAAWLEGHSDAGIDLNGGIELPLFLKPQISALLKAAVLADENRPNDADPFVHGGVWHRAVCAVMFALSRRCKAMTAHYEYPHGLGLADGAFNSFMAAIVALGIELPTSEEIAAADAVRAARAEQATAAVQEGCDWGDDAEAYDYT